MPILYHLAGSLCAPPLPLDDALVAKAHAFTGLNEKSSLLREALTARIERESAIWIDHLRGHDAV